MNLENKKDVNLKQNGKTIKLLITGGSGFIGTNAMNWALENSLNVLNLDLKQPQDIRHNKYWKHIDIRNRDYFLYAVKQYKPTHVLHLAAKTGMDIKDISVLDANTVGVQNLIDISNMVDTIERIIFTSSLLVCKNGYIPTSMTEYCPPNLYGESKVIGEKLVRSAEMNCEWVIVRPTSIWGPWFEHSYKAFFRTIDKNRYFHIGDKEFCKPACFVGNAVYMMTKLLFENEPQISKSTYYLADYPWYSTKQWANTIQKVLGSKKIKTAPVWLLHVIAKFGDVIKLVTMKDFPLTSFRLKNMLTGGEYPTNNTKEICGELPYNLTKSVMLTTGWMYSQKIISHKPKELQ